MTMPVSYPIGTPGQPWGDAEKAAWLARQRRQRSYADDVLGVIDRLRARFDVEQYGLLDYAPETFPLFAIRSRDWREDLPSMLVTGGVHGYETSGVHGALQFVERHMADYEGRANLLVAPCISPWAYERIHRSNLVGMGILPLQFAAGETAENLGLTGEEVYSIEGLAEGVKTAKSAFDLGQRLGIELPIITETYRVLYEDKPALEAVKDLMGRELTAEFESMRGIRAASPA